MSVDKFRFPSDEDKKIDRAILQLPEFIIESFDIDPKNSLREMFDLVWNACGYERSYNYDENGNWTAN